MFLQGGVFLVGAASSYRHLEARGQERRFSPLVHAGGALGTRGAIKNKSDLPTCYYFWFFRFLLNEIFLCAFELLTQRNGQKGDSKTNPSEAHKNTPKKNRAPTYLI